MTHAAFSLRFERVNNEQLHRHTRRRNVFAS